MRKLRTLLALAAAAPLAACISFGGKPPPTLLSLTPATVLPAGAASEATEDRTIAVFIPAVPQSLATGRVAVQVSPNQIAYLKDAQWVDAPPRLFRALLAETISAKTGRVTLDAREYSLAPAARLAGHLELFGLDAGSRTATVRYDAALIRKTGGTLEERRFEAHAPVSGTDGPTVAAALNQAANEVANQVADWVG